MILALLSISSGLQEGFNSLFGFISNLIGFLLIVVVGWLIARVVRTLIDNGLEAELGDDLDLGRHQSGFECAGGLAYLPELDPTGTELIRVVAPLEVAVGDLLDQVRGLSGAGTGGGAAAAVAAR